jgi:hypothetical protein
MAYQPHEDILRRAYSRLEGDFLAAEARHRFATRVARVNPAELAQSTAAIEQLHLAARRSAFAEIDTAIRPSQDRMERLLAIEGAGNIARFSGINMLRADVPA